MYNNQLRAKVIRRVELQGSNAAGVHRQVDRNAYIPEDDDGPDLDLFFWLAKEPEEDA